MSFMVLAGFLVASFLAAVTGAFFRPGQWYRELNKPRWRPPDWVFGPVWAALYVLIAISGWLVWRTTGLTGSGLSFVAYAIQLMLNAAWSPVFFGLHRPGTAFVVIVLMWIAIAVTTVLFFSISALAALLLLPYLAWVTFAAALNFAIMRRNSSG